METKMKKEEKLKQKEKLSDIITAKMAIVFVALVAAIILIIRVTEYSLFTEWQLLAARIAFGVLTVAAGIWWLIAYKKGVDNKRTVLSAPFFFGLFGSGLFAALVLPSFFDYRTILSLIAFTVVFFVYEIYPFDFFVGTAAMVVSCICAVSVDYAGFAGYTVFVNALAVVASAAVTVLAAVLLLKLRKDGKLRIGSNVFKKAKGGTPVLLYVGIAAAFVSVILAFIFPYILYLVAATCAIYLVVAIIYTVKLM